MVDRVDNMLQNILSYIFDFQALNTFAFLPRITCGCFCKVVLQKLYSSNFYEREASFFLKCAYHSRVLERNPFQFFIQTNHTRFHELYKYELCFEEIVYESTQ